MTKVSCFVYLFVECWGLGRTFLGFASPKTFPCGLLCFLDAEELKVMSSVEEKSPGQYTRGIREKFSDSKGFSTDRMIFKAPFAEGVGIWKQMSVQKKRMGKEQLLRSLTWDENVLGPFSFHFFRIALSCV